MPINTMVDLVFINNNPRHGPRSIRLPVSCLAAILLAATVLVGWLGFAAIRIWDQRELRAALANQEMLKADIRRLLPGVGQAQRALFQAEESNNLAAIVFGVPTMDPHLRPAEFNGTTIYALESTIQETNQQTELEINSISATIAAVNRKLSRHTPLAPPINGRITSRFGVRRHPIFGSLLFHYGLDIAGTKGTLIKAPAAGLVLASGYSTRSGRFLRIDHRYGYTSLYTHLDRISVRKGQRISRGQTIAALGNTGLTTGPHLHYEIHWKGKPIDPEPFLAGSPVYTDSPQTKSNVLYFKSQCLQAAHQKQDSSFTWPWSSG